MVFALCLLDFVCRSNISNILFSRTAFAAEAEKAAETASESKSDLPEYVDKATGLEQQELLAAMEGKVLFDWNPIQPASFGTKENPLKIKSAYGIRYMSCQGNCNGEFVLNWTEVQ